MKKKTNVNESKIASMKTAIFDVSYLREHKATYNPRVISDESKAGLSLCVDKFGYLQPIIFNTRTERIVSGHQRIDLLYEKGFEKAQVTVVDLPEDLEKELNIAMNSGTVTGEFTPAVNDLIQEILDIDAEFFDMLNLGSLSMIGEEEDEGAGVTSGTANTTKKDSIPGMELLPYEHYDCLLVVFKNVDDFLYLSSALKLDEKRIISSPNVKNKKVGKLRAVSADKVIELIKKDDKFDLPDIDMNIDL